ncbi:MAG: dimethylsulfonioproprionate lyase family protein, partial [Gammaproteobacteria bacterium]|nr:dimethylsulfonioproprionate lyase family protein [Gammaproteobacteria bacterium]
MGPVTAERIRRLPVLSAPLPLKSIALSMQPALEALGSHLIRPDLEALLPYLPWQLRGASENYAWVELIGPDGIQYAADFRVGLYWQDADALYPLHRHNAAELYYIFVGAAGWQRGDEQEIIRPPGSYFLHASGQCHSTRTYSQQLLSIWAWDGDIGWESYTVDPAPIAAT